jgi:hypothetical protein
MQLANDERLLHLPRNRYAEVAISPSKVEFVPERRKVADLARYVPTSALPLRCAGLAAERRAADADAFLPTSQVTR